MKMADTKMMTQWMDMMTNPAMMDAMMKMMNPTLMMNMMSAMTSMGNAGASATNSMNKAATQQAPKK